MMGFEIGRQDVELFLSNYDLSGLEKISRLEGGWDNTNLLLSLIDGSELVLKVWNANTNREVSRIIQCHQHLGANGIPTPIPLEAVDGSLIVIQNNFSWTLLPYYEGGFLGSDSDSLKSLGTAIAKMHSIPIIDCFPQNYRMGLAFFEDVLDTAVRGSLSADFLKLLAEEVSSIKSNFPTNLPNGVLHGDLFPDNVIGHNGEVSAILDLEESWIGPCVFDLAMAFVGFGWKGKKPQKESFRALLEGYEIVRKLSDKERSAIPFMHRYATVAIAAWRFWKHNLSDPDDALSTRYLEMVDRLDIEFDFTGLLS